MWVLGTKLGPPQEQQVLLATKISPHPPALFSYSSVGQKSGSRWADGKGLVGKHYFWRLKDNGLTLYSF